MNHFTRIIDEGEGHAGPGQLPGAVQGLCPRMRQIATAVYLTGGATVQEVHASIEEPPSIYAIRTMLNRLRRRGIVKSRRSGKHSSLVYLPAVVTPEFENQLVRGLIDRHFNGSSFHALELLLQLTARDQAQAQRPLP